MTPVFQTQLPSHGANPNIHKQHKKSRNASCETLNLDDSKLVFINKKLFDLLNVTFRGNSKEFITIDFLKFLFYFRIHKHSS